jgi:hypothetical protein
VKDPAAQRITWRLGLATVALFLVVWGLKLHTVHRFGSDLPNWDQWDAEGNMLFQPWLENRLRFVDLFAPHNEHRIVCTKLLSLALLEANGQWDARYEEVINAAIHAALAALAFLWGARRMRDAWKPVWFVALAAFVGPPHAWQNVLGGFHSQQYFLLWFSLLAIGLLLTRQPVASGQAGALSLRGMASAHPAEGSTSRSAAGWWAGIACATLALFTQASGLLAAAAVAVLLVVDGHPRDVLRRHGVTLALCVGLIGAGWLLRVEVAVHEGFKAKTASDFFLTFWRSLQWPATGLIWFPLIAWAPWTRLTWCTLRGGTEADRAHRVIVAAGVWVLLQYLATAYARGAGAPWPASRYFDTVMAGIGVNVLAALVLLSRGRNGVVSGGWRTTRPTSLQAGVPRWVRVAEVAVALIGVAVLTPNLWREWRDNWHGQLPNVRAIMERREDNTRLYLATNDPARLEGVDIPYPNAAVLADRLKSPSIRELMPASVRPALPVAAAEESGGVFAPGALPPALGDDGAVPAWGSYGGSGPAATGVWRSAPLSPARFAYWQFEVAGTGGSLTIHDAGNEPMAQLLPDRSLLNTWQKRVIGAPDEPAILVARDVSEREWFAFRGPVEVAAGSWWAERAAAAGGTIVCLGIASGLVALGFGVAVWRRERVSSGVQHSDQGLP